MTDGNRRGYLESVLIQLPGFKGYLAREYRRDSDRACREHLAARLRAAKKAVGEAKRKLLSAGKLEGLETLDRVSDRLERVVSKVTYADGGFAGFFDKSQLGSEELDRLKEADLGLTDLALALEEKLSALAKAPAGDALSLATGAALDAIETFETTFDQRKRVLAQEA